MGSGTLTAIERMDIGGGKISGTGSINIPTQATLNISDASGTTNFYGWTINNAGTTTWTAR